MTKSRHLGDIAQLIPPSIGSAAQTLKVNSGGTSLEYADAGGGVTVYAEISNMTGSSAAVGSMAWVTANQSIYVKNTSGWYKIALANSTPSITSPATGAITLATDGAATIVSIVGADADENVTLQFSYQVTTGSLTNGGGASATVTSSATSSGTYTALAASTNTLHSHFKITPSTTEAYAGSFSITFNCTDQINTASIVKSFTLLFDSISAAKAKFNFGEYTNRGSGSGFNTYIANYNDSDSKIGNRSMGMGSTGRGAMQWVGGADATTYSVGMWAKAAHTAAGSQTYRYIWGSALTGSSGEKQALRWDKTNNRFELYENSNQYYFGNYAQSSGNSQNSSGFTAFTSGNNGTSAWTHLVVTASPTNGTKLYINGTAHGWRTDTNVSPFGNVVCVGDKWDKYNNSGSDSGTNLKGNVDQFFFIASELSASEVGVIYNLTSEWS